MLDEQHLDELFIAVYQRLSSLLLIRLNLMRSLATLSMRTKLGRTSTWHFAQCSDGWYAFGGCHKPLVKRFDSVKSLRALYKTYLSYGYKPQGKTDARFVQSVIIADPWESELPVSMQLELQALAA